MGEILILNFEIEAGIAIVDCEIDHRPCKARIQLPKNYPKTQVKRVLENIIRGEILGSNERKYVIEFESKNEDFPRVLHKEIAEILEDGQFVYDLYIKYQEKVIKIQVTTPKTLRKHKDLHDEYLKIMLPVNLNLHFGYAIDKIEYDLHESGDRFDDMFEEHLQKVHGCPPPLKPAEEYPPVMCEVEGFEDMEDWRYNEMFSIPLSAEQEKRKMHWYIRNDIPYKHVEFPAIQKYNEKRDSFV